MENSINNIAIPPITLFLATVFQIWMIVFPILLIRKINYLTALVYTKLYDEENVENQDQLSA